MFSTPCVVQIIQDFKEDTMRKRKAKQAVQDPNDDTKGKPPPPPDPKTGGDFILDVKQRQIALTNAGLNRAFARLCKLPMHLYMLHTVTTPVQAQSFHSLFVQGRWANRDHLTSSLRFSMTLVRLCACNQHSCFFFSVPTPYISV